MKPPPQAARAFTLVEILVALGIVAILGTVGYVSITGVREQAASSKLEQDVKVLNNAIDTYLASGGSMAGVTTASGALARLKTRANAASVEATLGATGSFVDPRTQAVIQTSAEAASSAPRAYFTASPSPRFFTATSGAAGIKEFTLDEAAAAAAPVTEGRSQTMAQGSTWIWNYEDTAPPQAPAMLVPTAVDASVSLPPGTVVLPLQPPVISPAGSTLTLDSYPLPVAIANPNPSGSSAIYYSVQNGPYVLYVAQFNVNPGDVVRAVAVTLDPSRYYSSGTVTETYSVSPLQLVVGVNAPSSLTYAQVGGAINGQAVQTAPNATVTLISSVPSQYRSSANFSIRYTMDGSDPTAAGNSAAQTGPSFIGTFNSPQISLNLTNWGTNSSITIRAAAVPTTNTTWFISSAVAQATVQAAQTALGAPTITPGAQRVLTSLTVTNTAPVSVPVAGGGVSLRYTTDNTVPSASLGTVYSAPFVLGPFSINQQRTVRAITLPPATLSNWFTASPVTSVTYNGPNFNYRTGGGLLISGGTFANNATVRGSITVATVTNGSQPNITFSQNSETIGDVFLPGTPTVTGVSTNRIIDLDGSITPTNYTIRFENNSVLTGSVYRRIDPQVVMPTVTAPTGLTTFTNTVTSGALASGRYTKIDVPNNGAITLGVAGSTNATVYRFDSPVFGTGISVNVVGPVVLAISGNFEVKPGMVMGNVNNPEWLQVEVLNGASFTLKQNATFYGTIKNPTGTVTFENNTVFVGGVVARTFNLENNGDGIVFSLPPPI